MCGRTGRPVERHATPAGTAARSATRAPGGRRAAASGRVDIAERPGEEKSRVGDWEGDTGARHRGAVPSLVDRASKFTLLALLGGRTAGETGEAMRKRPGPYKEFVRTTDNGKEFAANREVAGARVVLLRAAVPGAQPERATGWFASISRRRPASWIPPNRVEDFLDNRVRKALDYQTPAEVFKRALTGGPAPLKRNPADPHGQSASGRTAGGRRTTAPGRRRAAPGSQDIDKRRIAAAPARSGVGPGKIFRRGRGDHLRSGRGFGDRLRVRGIVHA